MISFTGLNMNTTQIRNQAKQYIDQLSPESLRFVANFLAYLAEKESNEATDELLAITGFKSAFERGKQQVKEGKVKDWRTIRDDV